MMIEGDKKTISTKIPSSTRIAYSDVTDFPKGLEIQTSSKYNCVAAGRWKTYSAKCQTLTVSLNFHLSLFHLLHQRGISDDASSIPDFSTGFIEASNDPYNRPLGYISQCRQLVEGLK
jgi:hypothetical protein